MNICFPGETTVTTKQGVKRLDEIQPGIEILTLGRKSSTPKWTKFYTWGHREPGAVAEFLLLKLINGKVLKISEEHLLFVAGDEGKKLIKTAGSICKGDKLVFGGFGSPIDLVTVDEISGETLTGVYAPFTTTGHFLANGFLVGCYADVGRDFDVAHTALAPLRTKHRLASSPTKGDLNRDGIHGYAKYLAKLREFLPRNPFLYVLSHI